MGEGRNELKFEIHKTIADSIRYQGLGNSSASLWGFWILILTIIKKRKKKEQKVHFPLDCGLSSFVASDCAYMDVATVDLQQVHTSLFKRPDIAG